jgi:hypothetical protein
MHDLLKIENELPGKEQTSIDQDRFRTSDGGGVIASHADKPDGFVDNPGDNGE